MKQVCEGLPTWGHLLVWVGWLLWDYCMGETKEGSAVRIFLSSVASIVRRIKKEKEK